MAAVPLLVGIVSGLLAGVPAIAAPQPTPSPTVHGSITVVIPGSSENGNGNGGNGNGGNGSGGNGNGNGSPGGHNSDGSPIPADHPQENAPNLTLDKDRAEPDEWVIATAAHYTPGEKALVVFYPGAIVIGSYTVGSDGVFSARFRIPEDARTGAWVVEVTGWESGYITNGELTVISGTSTASWLSLWWVYLVLGVVLVAFLSMLAAFRTDIPRWFGTSPDEAGA